ncbi:MAG: N-acetyltransferase [Ruminococcus sp.]|nr:N-acetyltransferase [Ruminococcus sp.]
MITVREVKTKKEQKQFIDFPLDLYRDCPYFVPPLYGDEKGMFKKNFTYNDCCDIVNYLAFDGEKPVGRIQGIIQRAANEKNNEKRVRFTRFDAVENQEVADKLFDAVEKWAKNKGMDTICGPLGFSDLEREGLLVDGFDQLSTFEEQYNYEYYGKLIESLGFEKEVDWTESKIYPPENDDGTMQKMADFVMNRYHLHFGQAKNIDDFINKYGDDFFGLIDKGYENLYGTVPFTKAMKDEIIKSFKLIVDLKHVAIILDENDRAVCIGVCFPSIAKAVQKSKGKLTPAALIRLLKAIKHPTVIDFGLIAVDPTYLNRGVSTAISAEVLKMLKDDSIEYAETNLNLETNAAIQNQWKRFKEVKHKRRRAYVKKIGQ